MYLLIFSRVNRTSHEHPILLVILCDISSLLPTAANSNGLSKPTSCEVFDFEENMKCVHLPTSLS